MYLYRGYKNTISQRANFINHQISISDHRCSSRTTGTRSSAVAVKQWFGIKFVRMSSNQWQSQEP